MLNALYANIGNVEYRNRIEGDEEQVFMFRIDANTDAVVCVGRDSRKEA